MDEVEVVKRHCEAYADVDVATRMRSVLEAWRSADAQEREDLMRRDPAWSLAAPEIRVRTHLGPDQVDGQGWEAVFELFAGWYAFWEEYTFHIRDYRRVGDGLVLNSVDVRGRARSGMPLTMTSYELREVRNGRIVRWEIFGSEQDALRAAGDAIS